MSRVMKRTVPAGHAYGSGITLLTCPTSHKYEVLEVGVWGDSSGGVIYAITATLGGNLVIADEIDATPAGRYSWRSTWNALVLEAGDTIDMVGAGGSGTFSTWCTYMDVDTS